MTRQKHDTKWLYSQYIEKKIDAVDIARELGVTSGAVYDMLRRRGIKRRSNSEAQRLVFNYPMLWDKNYLSNAYLKEKLTTYEIAQRIGCNEESVRKALIRYKIPRRSKGTRYFIEEVRDKDWLYEQYVTKNKSQLQIAEELDCGETVINKWVRKHKIHKDTRWSGNDFTESKSNRNSKEYDRWRKQVLKRDGKCVHCGALKRLQAHHIKTFAHNIELRYLVQNGVTLCQKCHRKFHSSHGLLQ
jgi:transposase